LGGPGQVKKAVMHQNNTKKKGKQGEEGVNSFTSGQTCQRRRTQTKENSQKGHQSPSREKSEVQGGEGKGVCWGPLNEHGFGFYSWNAKPKVNLWASTNKEGGKMLRSGGAGVDKRGKVKRAAYPPIRGKNFYTFPFNRKNVL